MSSAGGEVETFYEDEEDFDNGYYDEEDDGSEL
jgi:hypothetical protein